jgi:hypothetical protein
MNRYHLLAAEIFGYSYANYGSTPGWEMNHQSSGS